MLLYPADQLALGDVKPDAPELTDDLLNVGRIWSVSFYDGPGDAQGNTGGHSVAVGSSSSWGAGTAGRYWRTGVGGCVLTGADNTLSLPSGGFTVHLLCDFSVTTLGSNNHLIGAYQATSPFNGWALRLDASGILAMWDGSGFRTIGTTDLRTLSWPSVVAVCYADGTKASYVNGVLDGSNATATHPGTYTGTKRLGARADGSTVSDTDFLVAQADVWSRALTAGQIARLAAVPWVGLVAPLAVPLSVAGGGGGAINPPLHLFTGMAA